MCEDFMSERESIGTPRTCRVCGCTDADCSNCIASQGFPCHWVEADLCSRCASGAKAVSEEQATLNMIKGTISAMTPADAGAIQQLAGQLRVFLAQKGSLGYLAFALVGAELAAVE